MNAFLVFALKLYFVYLKGRVAKRERRRGRVFPSTGSLSTWLQWPGLDQVAVRPSFADFSGCGLKVEQLGLNLAPIYGMPVLPAVA